MLGVVFFLFFQGGKGEGGGLRCVISHKCNKLCWHWKRWGELVSVSVSSSATLRTLNKLETYTQCTCKRKQRTERDNPGNVKNKLAGNE